MTRHRPELSDQEKALFRTHVEDVTPLKKGNKHHAPKTPPAAKYVRSLPPSNASVKKHPHLKLDIFLSDSYPETVAAETVLAFTTQNLPKKYLQELKNGLLPIEATLDLHGLRRDAAADVLLTFLAQQIALNHRFLLIIHGKGGFDSKTPPLLKNLLNHWLRQIPQILAFHSALPKAGGTGAVYVCLKRAKPG